jgi:uracil-DNA glycosylase family 4
LRFDPGKVVLKTRDPDPPAAPPAPEKDPSAVKDPFTPPDADLSAGGSTPARKDREPQEPEPQKPEPQEPKPQEPEPQEPESQEPKPQEPKPQEPESAFPGWAAPEDGLAYYGTPDQGPGRADFAGENEKPGRAPSGEVPDGEKTPPPSGSAPENPAAALREPDFSGQGSAPPEESRRPAAALPALWINSSKNLSELKAGVDGCALCPLGRGAPRRFFGRGPLSPRILLATGVVEKETAREGDFLKPEEWELLRSIIVKGLKLSLEEVYVTPVVKCPGEIEDFVPPRSLAVCRNVTLKEIKLANPRAVVSFGAEAAQCLSRENAVLGTLRRKKDLVVESGETLVPFQATVGLENMLEFPLLKKDAWEDLKRLLKRL